MRTRHLLVWFAFLLLTLGGCFSWQNREGPSATCAELEDGKVNACRDGIIATCASGRVTYEVCDDKDACDASWQTEGQFQC
jgi:hypothetical protein